MLELSLVWTGAALGAAAAAWAVVRLVRSYGGAVVVERVAIP